MRAHQIMTRPVITVTPETTTGRSREHHASGAHQRGLPVVDAAGKLVGTVSKGDFTRRSEIGTQRKHSRWLRFILGPGKLATSFVHEHGREVAEIMTEEPLALSRLRRLGRSCN